MKIIIKPTHSIFFAVFHLALCSIIFSQTATLEPTLKFVTINSLSIPYQNGIPLPSFEKQKSRTLMDLAGNWKKLRFLANDNVSLLKRDSNGIAALEFEALDRHLKNFNDSEWEEKLIPSVENKLKSANNAPEFYSDGIWYRRKFNVDQSYSGKFIKLFFYEINYVCDIWINGKYVGYHEGGYTPFAFDVSSFLEYGAENSIAVRVDNIEWGKRKDIVPYTIPDWFNYAGIIHDVYLEVSDPISVIRADVVPKDLNGSITSKIVLLNSSNSSKSVKVEVRVFEGNIDQNNIQSEYSQDLAGREVSLVGNSIFNQSLNAKDVIAIEANLKIESPKLWEMKSPNLYIMKVSVSADSKILDEYYTQFGIRTVEVKNGRFLLNNRIWFLTGTARHEEHPDYGRSVPKNIIYSDLQTIKDLNVLYLRTSHYPNHPYTYLISDRLGLAVMEEIPVYWFDTEEAWKIQNENRKIHLQMFREMVFKDINRPSVIMWSASNECLDVPNRKIFHKMVVDDRNQNYPDGRIITQSAAADRPGPADDSQNSLDVPGWTMYFGVFHKFNWITPRLDEAFGGTFAFLNNAKANFPDKPFIATEFGYWSSENNSSLNDQSYIFNETFKAFKFHAPYNEAGIPQSLGNLFGVTWWAAFDWYQYKTNGWQTMGLISMDRKTIKPVATVLKSAYLPFYSKDGLAVSVESSYQKLPQQFKLNQNYPNPFNPTTSISYELMSDGFVNLKIFDVLGKEVIQLVNEFEQAGKKKVEFNASTIHDKYPLTSGFYFYSLKVKSKDLNNVFSQTKKMIFLK